MEKTRNLDALDRLLDDTLSGVTSGATDHETAQDIQALAGRRTALHRLRKDTAEMAARAPKALREFCGLE